MSLNQVYALTRHATGGHENAPPTLRKNLAFVLRGGRRRTAGNRPKALITAGLLGGGQCGTGGDDYQHVSESPYVDVVHYRDYGADGVTLPGDQWNGLARRIDQAEAAGKPLLVAEIGEWAGSGESLEDRALHIADKIKGRKSAGTAGALLWAFVPDPRPLNAPWI